MYGQEKGIKAKNLIPITAKLPKGEGVGEGKQNPGIGFVGPNVEKLDEALQAGRETYSSF